MISNYVIRDIEFTLMWLVIEDRTEFNARYFRQI